MQVNAVIKATSTAGKKINTTISHLRESQESKAEQLGIALNALTTNTYESTQINEIDINPGSDKVNATFNFISPATIASGSAVTVNAEVITDYTYKQAYYLDGSWGSMSTYSAGIPNVTRFVANYKGTYPLRIMGVEPETENYKSIAVIKLIQSDGTIVDYA